MASNINPYNIDGTFPVAGQDNPSQGFRDNFTNIKNNFLFAQTEIDDLQGKVLVTAALNGQNILNDMAGTKITRPQLSAWTQTLYDLGAVATSATLDFNEANFQKLTTASSINLDFVNWPTSVGTGALGYGLMRVWIVLTDVSHTVTLPASVTVGATDLAGYNPDTNTITFDVAVDPNVPGSGNYIFDFSSIDGGNTYLVFDATRNHATFRDPSFYLNDVDTLNPTLFIGYNAGLSTAQQFEIGQDAVSTLGSYNSVAVGSLSEANVAYTQMSTGSIGGYSVSAARGNIQLGNIQPVLNNDLIGYVNSIGYTGTGTAGANTFQQLASIDFFATGNASSTSYTNGLGGNVAIFTATDGSIGLNRVNQAVGIENDQSVKFYGSISIVGNITSNVTIDGNVTYTAGVVDKGYQYLGVPSSGFVQQITPGKSRLIINPGVTLATGNVILPNVATDGTIVSVSTTANITAFGATSLQSGTVVKPSNAVTLLAGTKAEYFYHASANSWYKIG
jgi:hypothetical protein